MLTSHNFNKGNRRTLRSSQFFELCCVRILSLKLKIENMFTTGMLNHGSKQPTTWFTDNDAIGFVQFIKNCAYAFLINKNEKCYEAPCGYLINVELSSSFVMHSCLV